MSLMTRYINAPEICPACGDPNPVNYLKRRVNCRKRPCIAARARAKYATDKAANVSANGVTLDPPRNCPGCGEPMRRYGSRWVCNPCALRNRWGPKIPAENVQPEKIRTRRHGDAADYFRVERCWRKMSGPGFMG